MANLVASGLSTTSKLEREAERALRDPLTGLANRFIFMDRLAHHGYEARRYGRPYGLFLIDLNRLSVVVESLGQEWGDAVLRSVAQGLHNTVRGGDTLAASVGVAWSDGTAVSAEELLGQARASLDRARTAG